MSYNIWNGESQSATMDDLKGKTFWKVERTDDELKLHCEEGVYTFYHSQDCCEDVHIESIVGELSDLVDSPILLSEESTKEDEDAYEAGMWTFYKFATIKGYVDVRWYGSSNGYYSIGVDLIFTPK